MKVGALIREYLRRNPTVRDCFYAGLINNAALAREILQSERLDTHPHGLIMALSRFRRRLPIKQLQDAKKARLLRSAKITSTTGFILAALDLHKYDQSILKFINQIKRRRRECHFIEGQEYVTIAVQREFQELLNESFRGSIHSLFPDVAIVSVILDPKTQLIPGITAYILRLVADAGINVLEITTSLGEDMLIIDEKDLISTLGALKVR